MSISMYAASVPVFKQMLGSLVVILEKADAYCTARGIDPAVLLQTRLFPDMLPLVRQVQIAGDFATGVAARLAGDEVPTYDDNEQSLEQLKERLQRILAFLESFDASRFEGSEQREILTRPGTPKERRFTGQDYLLTYGLPQFFFHVTTAYALLRHSGLEIGKRDYMGAY